MFKYGVTAFLIGLIIAIAGAVGWVLNLAKVFAGVDAEMTRQMVLRIIGVIAFPLGSFLGFM
jgi:hypothetical protein